MKTTFRFIRAGFACAALAATAAGALGAADPMSRAEHQCRTVQANIPWQDSGVSVGRIGTNAPFLIEKQLCFIPAAPGELRLSMNDQPGTFDNNRGSMHVQIVKWADARWAPGRIKLDPHACRP